MITKILFTALVIAVVIGVTRFRARQPSPPAPRFSPTQARSRAPRMIAYAVAGVMALAAVLVYYLSWSDWHEVVTIRVINTRTGEAATYEAHKGTIEDRSFKTVDGWKVTVSEAERVEIKGADE